MGFSNLRKDRDSGDLITETFLLPELKYQIWMIHMRVSLTRAEVCLLLRQKWHQVSAAISRQRQQIWKGESRIEVHLTSKSSPEYLIIPAMTNRLTYRNDFGKFTPNSC